MPNTTFNVVIKGMKARDIPALDANGTSDPFLKVNFDNFKNFSTAVMFKNLMPEWEEEVAFQYMTKYADCLSRKSVVFEVFDHNRFSANELIGTAKLDLHTIATGCLTHELPIRDGRKTRGTLIVSVVMEQSASTEMRMVQTTLTVPSSKRDIVKAFGPLELSCVVPSGKATAKVGEQKTASSSMTLELLTTTGWPHPDVLYFEGDLAAIAATSINFNLKANNKLLGSAFLLIDAARSFVEGESVDFAAAFEAAPGTGLPAGCTVKGSLIYTGFPVFTQMIGGLHTEAGISCATYPFPEIPFRPRCSVMDEGGKELAGPTSASLASKPKAAGGPASAASSNLAARKAVAPEDLTKPKYMPGNPAGMNPPSINERLFGGAPGLPVCWVRREGAPEAGGTAPKVVFENLCSGLLEQELTKDAEYVITLPAVETPGPLGMQLEPNFAGTQRFGFSSGRRNSGYDLGAVVRGLKQDSPLLAAGKLRPGHHLIAINGASTMKMTFDATVAALRGASRPLILRFHDPYAVPAALCVQALKANLTAKQSAGGFAPTTAWRGQSGVKPAGSKTVYSKPMVSEAQRTLDLALEMLAKVNVAEGLAAEGEGGALGKALQDAGLLRTLTAAVTGSGGDAAPQAVRERLEADQKEADASVKAAVQAQLLTEMNKTGAAGFDDSKGGNDVEEEDADDFSPLAATARAITSDATAARALRAVSALSGSASMATASESTQAAMTVTANRMAELGVFSRTVAAVQVRPAVMQAAMMTLAGAAPMLSEEGSVAEGFKTMGLDGASLIIMQNAGRRQEYAPAMAEQAAIVMNALATENPEQDGRGFLELVAAAVTAVATISAAGYYRAKAPDGATYYLTPSGESEWDPPAQLRAAFKTLFQMEKRSRVIEDAAIVSATGVTITLPGPDGRPSPVPLLTALPYLLTGQTEDVYVSCALLSAMAKLCSLPLNASALMKAGVLRSADAALEAHPAEPRIAECYASLQFNIGRDLDMSQPLLISGTVAKISTLARAYLRHKSTFTGSPSPWPPEGLEEEAGEVVVLPGQDRRAREKNSLAPRLVRICINVLINLACYRRSVSFPTPGGGPPKDASSVDLIQQANGVALLGEVLLAHINDSTVVTAVLNCAANIAFKNRDVQLTIGETMTDAIILSGWSFQRDVNLLSMALRAIGNLTNEDANIYRGLGHGMTRMIAAAMRANAAAVPLQTLAASVLSNVASVEPVDNAEDSAEDVGMFVTAVEERRNHPAIALRPSPEDAAVVSALLQQRKNMWQIAPALLVDEGAVSCLTFAMTKYAQDVSLVEACLRTLQCICSDEEVTVSLVLHHDLVSRVLFVMRACDFDVHVQEHGANLLAIAASNVACATAVVGTDAAHALLMALDTHKGSLSTALSAATHAVATVGGTGEVVAPEALMAALEGAFADGKARAVLQLLVKACDVLGLFASPRATAAALELSAPASLLALLTSLLTLFNTLAARGYSFAHPPASTRSAFVDCLALGEAAAMLLSEWLRHPSARLGAPIGPDGRPYLSPDEETASFAARALISAGGRAWSGVVRLLEMAVLLTPGVALNEPGAVTLACPPKLLRALTLIPAAIMLRVPVLPDRSALVSAAKAAAGLGPASWPVYAGVGSTLDVEGQGLDALARAGAAPALAAVAVGLAAYVYFMLDESAHIFSTRGSVTWDNSAIAGRAGCSAALLLVDALGSVASPMEDAAPYAARGAAAASAILSSACTAFAPFLRADLVPSPLRVADLADLASRAATHTGGRAATAGASPIAPVVAVGEARAVFAFNAARAREAAAMSNAGNHAMTPVARPPPALGATSAPPPPRPGPPAPGGPAAPGAAPVDARSATPTKTLRRAQSSRRGFVGRLGEAAGILVTSWLDGKAQNVCLRSDEAMRDLLLFPRPEKTGGKLPAGLALEVPMAIVPGGAYATVRIGKILKDGQAVKSGGMFARAPKADRTVCVDSATGNTIVGLEAASVAEATTLVAALEGLAQSAMSQ